MTTSTTRPKLLAAALLIVLGAFALLSSGESEATGATATSSAARTVSIKGFAFKPATLKVDRGSRVTFANSSNATHTATGASFDTKRIAPGEATTIRFNKSGTFAYHCKIHSFMKGKVIVE